MGSILKPVGRWQASVQGIWHPPKVAPASPELAAAERMHGGRRAAMASVPQVPRAGAASPTGFGTGPFL